MNYVCVNTFTFLISSTCVRLLFAYGVVWIVQYSDILNYDAMQSGRPLPSFLCNLLQVFLKVFTFIVEPEEGGSRFLRNYLQDFTMSRRPESTAMEA